VSSVLFPTAGDFLVEGEDMADTKIEAIEAENASWTRTVKDLAAGAAGGVAQVLLGKSVLCFGWTVDVGR
jgi:hypothetical protein